MYVCMYVIVVLTSVNCLCCGSVSWFWLCFLNANLKKDELERALPKVTNLQSSLCR